MATSTAGLFSFAHTEPSADFLVQSWVPTTAEGTQNLHDFPDTGSAHSGEHEDLFFVSGSSTPRGIRMDPTQTADIWTTSRVAAMPSGGQAMSRIDSTRSSGSTLSRSSQLSDVHSTGNASTYRSGPQSDGSIAGMDHGLMDPESATVSTYWTDYTIDLTTMGLDGGQLSMSNVSPMQVLSHQMTQGPDESSPLPWDVFPSAISPSSSSSSVEDCFSIRPLSPHSSPDLTCQSPR